MSSCSGRAVEYASIFGRANVMSAIIWFWSVIGSSNECVCDNGRWGCGVHCSFSHPMWSLLPSMSSASQVFQQGMGSHPLWANPTVTNDCFHTIWHSWGSSQPEISRGLGLIQPVVSRDSNVCIFINIYKQSDPIQSNLVQSNPTWWKIIASQGNLNTTNIYNCIGKHCTIVPWLSYEAVAAYWLYIVSSQSWLMFFEKDKTV